MRKRGYSLIAVLLAIFCLSSISTAALLNNNPELPQISYNSTGTTHYNAGSDLFNVQASPVKIYLSAAGSSIEFESGGSLTINVEVGDTGVLAGGVPGNDFVLVGEVDLGADGVKSGVLLTGEVKEFGFYNSNTSTDIFDFRITLTGGELAFLFEGCDIGIVNFSESSNFTGLFTNKFNGGAKGNIVAVTCNGSIGDLVWHDLDRDGIQDAGEPGIPEVSVNLTGTDEAGNSVSMTDITSPNGFYQFTELCAGDYTVEVDETTLPPGFEVTTSCSSDQTIVNDSNSDNTTNCTPSQTVDLPDDNNNINNPTIDFGFVSPCDGSIGDMVWHDLDRDGIQDAGEPGIQGVGMKLTGTDVDGNLVSMTDITDANGNYLFLGLCEGTYEVEVDLTTVPTGFEPTMPCSSDQAIRNDSNSDDMTNCTPSQTVDLPDDNNNINNPTIDFGFVSPCDGSIGDMVWHDLNRNGILDTGEPGIQGVGVKLTGTDVDGNLVSMTDITDANGNYLFLGLCEGTYEVEVDLATVPAGFEPTMPCSDDQIIGNDSNSDDMTTCTPLQTVDLPDGNTDNTTIDFGFITPDCTLKVTKTCFVKQPPTSDFDCSDAKPIDSLTMIWGGSKDIESIDVYRDKYDPNDTMKNFMYTLTGLIGTGDEVTADGYAAADARNDVDWEITFSDGTSGVSRFHRSCSDDDMNGPEDCGKAEGNSKNDNTGFINDWIFEGMAGLTSGFKCNPDSPGSTSECTFQQAPPSPHCEGKLEAIALCYLGGSCPEPPHNTQPIDKQSCSGDAGAVQPVRIVITDGGSKIFLDQSDVEINDLVTATAANAGKNDFSSNTVFEIFDESGGLIQSGNFHTSCSQPLNLGDQFGSLQVVGMQTTEGGSIALGADVEYTYLVENMGDVTVFGVTVSDSVLGIVGSSIESLDSGKAVELFTTAFVDKTTINTVTVTGNTAFGDKCSARDSATVTMLLPPPCIVNPVEFKISDDKIEWKLSNDGDKVVTINSIEVSWPDTLEDLKKVKREKETIFEGPVPPLSALITSYMLTSDLKKRQIKPGESKKVKFEFAAKASTVPGDYEITVNFAENCSVTFEPADIPFLCSDAKPIETLTLIWTDALPVTVTSESGQSFDITDDTEREVTFDVLGLGNDVDVDIGGAVNGTSRFHVSCSDNEMNGLEDCGKPQGNGKDNNSGLNLWIFEGMAGNGLTLNCTP